MLSPKSQLTLQELIRRLTDTPGTKRKHERTHSVRPYVSRSPETVRFDTSPHPTATALESCQDKLMAEAPESKITFHFTTSIPTQVLTGERLAPIIVSLEGLRPDDMAAALEVGGLNVMASLMSADGRVPMALIDQNIFGGTTFAAPHRVGNRLVFRFGDLVIRQSGYFRIQFALIEREERIEQGDPASSAPTVPLSRHTEVIHVSAFVHERIGQWELTGCCEVG